MNKLYNPIKSPIPTKNFNYDLQKHMEKDSLWSLLPYSKFLGENGLYNVYAPYYASNRYLKGFNDLSNSFFYQLDGLVPHKIGTRPTFDTMKESLITDRDIKAGFDIKYPRFFGYYISDHNLGLQHNIDQEFIKPYNYFVNLGVDEMNRLLAFGRQTQEYYVSKLHLPRYIKYAVLELLQGASIFVIDQFGRPYVDRHFKHLLRSGILHSSGVYAMNHYPFSYGINHEYLKAVYNNIEKRTDCIIEKNTLDELLYNENDYEPVIAFERGYNFPQDAKVTQSINNFMNKLEFDLDAAMKDLDDYVDNDLFMEGYLIDNDIEGEFVTVRKAMAEELGIGTKNQRLSKVIKLVII
jgi:hypothetical protein